METILYQNFFGDDEEDYEDDYEEDSEEDYEEDSEEDSEEDEDDTYDDEDQVDYYVRMANLWYKHPRQLSEIPHSFVDLSYLYCYNDHIWFTQNMEGLLNCQKYSRNFLEGLSRKRTQDRLKVIEEELLTVSMRPDRIKNTGLCEYEKWSY